MPIDPKTGSVTVDHVLLDLSVSQVQELDVLGTLTLTPEQWSKLQEIDPLCPKRLDTVLSPSFHDSGDALLETLYAIRTARAHVAVTKADLQADERDELTRLKDGLAKGEDLVLWMNADGEFHRGGRHLEFSMLLKLIAASAEGRTSPAGSVVIHWPGDVSRDAKVPRERCNALILAAKKAWIGQDFTDIGDEVLERPFENIGTGGEQAAPSNGDKPSN
jgi:hypothetical protein